VRIVDPARPHEHAHPHDHDHDHDHHDHGHDHGHGHGHSHPAEDRTHTIAFEQAVLAKNDDLAAANRRRLTERGIVALNLMSSPGAGKTTLLTRTITDLAGSPDPLPVSVVEGDQETLLDARRISDTGARVVQINTGSGCHLDAAMVERGLRTLDPPERSVVFIENVGNLVCPALFDLGEDARVVIASTTEGEDKPLKYPQMFAAADLVLLNKVDLLPYLAFDVPRWLAGARRVNPHVAVLEVSATTGAGLDAWYGWLRRRVHGEAGTFAG
jgi:hydrogenase nickel incorporation protein HypB